MRIRSIKPEWLDDERLALASSDARTLSIALILLADDYGNGRANPVVLGARVFPGKVPETLAKALDTLAAVEFVTLYEVDGQRYFSIRNWSKHQKVDKPGKPQVPGPNDKSRTPEKIRESLAKVTESLATDQDQDQEGIGKGEEHPAREVAPHVRLFREYVSAVEAKTGRHEAETPEKLAAAKLALVELERTAANRKTTLRALTAESVSRWLADPWGKRTGWKFTEWAKQAAAIAVAEPEATKRGRQNVAPPTSHEDFARSVAEHGGEKKGWADVGI